MAKQISAEDILPLAAKLTPQERARLIRLIVEQQSEHGADIYRIMPPHEDEFTSNDDAIDLESEDWEEQD